MGRRLTFSTAILLTVPPLMWAGNAVVGRLVRGAVPPMTLNLLRWALALLILLPLGRAAFTSGSGMLANWRRYSLLGLFGIGLYNAFQYLALQSSTPINVTLVAAGMPVWMMLVGRIFFKVPVRAWQGVGAVLSIAGVLVVLCRGDWRQLAALRLVAGDLYMILATIAWSFYSWLLMQQKDVPSLRGDWAAFLLVQVIYGVLFSSVFAGVEWVAAAPPPVAWSGTLYAALAFVAIGPAVLAFRCWGAGVARAGPAIGAFFVNLTPLFAALLSAAFLHEAPHWYHVLAFALIVGGIGVSAR